MSEATDGSRVATAVFTIRVRNGEEGRFAHWLTRLNGKMAGFQGYVSSVVIPPAPPVQADWVLVQRFQKIDQLRAWLDSDERRSLMQESTSLLVDEGTTNVFEGANTEPSPHEMVTEIITVKVEPGKEAAYHEWVDRIRQMEATFPGYRGLQVQPPISGLQDHWVSMLRFDSAEHMNAWLESDVRRDALREIEPFIERSERQVATSFSGWFTFADAPGQAPPNWKQSMIVLLTLYPIVMLELIFLYPTTSQLGLAESTFIGNLITVAVTGFLLIPLAIKAFEWWLIPLPTGPRWVTPAGVALIVGLYGLSVGIFALLTQ